MSEGFRDAHIHLVDLLDRDPGFPERVSEGIPSAQELARLDDSRWEGPVEDRSRSTWSCCAASHDEGEWERSEALRARLPPFVSSFGIHPQWAVWKNADFLARLCAEGRIAAIGEAGFDFFGDRPERVRNAENESTQRAVFEYQLELAERHGLPILLHLRKAMDMAFAYASRLKRLPAAVFHSYSGTEMEAQSILRKGVNAYFSFGAQLLNGHKRAIAACASLPAERILAETDAPWQPPRRRAEAGSEGSGYCKAEDIALVVDAIAALRGVAREAAMLIVSRNFDKVFIA